MPADCDNGWVHLCGGPHEPRDENDDRELVPERPATEGGCLTVRCEIHCSCFAPDGVHDPDCFVEG